MRSRANPIRSLTPSSLQDISPILMRSISSGRFFQSNLRRLCGQLFEESIDFSVSWETKPEIEEERILIYGRTGSIYNTLDSSGRASGSHTHTHKKMNCNGASSPARADIIYKIPRATVWCIGKGAVLSRCKSSNPIDGLTNGEKKEKRAAI